MTQPPRELARPPGNPLGRVGHADVLELIAGAEHLAKMTERTVRLA